MCWMKPSGGQKEAEAAVADVQKFAPQLHREHLPGGSWLPQSRGTRALHCVTMRCDDPHISICHAMICWHGLTRVDDELCLRPASRWSRLSVLLATGRGEQGQQREVIRNSCSRDTAARCTAVGGARLWGLFHWWRIVYQKLGWKV